VTNIPIPPPSEPIASTDGRLNDVWYRYFESGSLGLNSASTVASAASTATTFAKTILATTTASAVRTILDVDQGSSFSPVVATTGTTGISLTTGIPAGVSHVRVLLDGVSITTTDPWYVRVGSTSGLLATGYQSASAIVSTAGTATAYSTIGFILHVAQPGRLVHGSMLLSRLTSHQWVASYALSAIEGTTGYGMSGGGTALLDADIDRVSITTTGVQVFDSGQASVHWDF
jgi:hypothetical protein